MSGGGMQGGMGGGYGGGYGGYSNPWNKRQPMNYGMAPQRQYQDVAVGADSFGGMAPPAINKAATPPALGDPSQFSNPGMATPQNSVTTGIRGQATPLAWVGGPGGQTAPPMMQNNRLEVPGGFGNKMGGPQMSDGFRVNSQPFMPGQSAQAAPPTDFSNPLQAQRDSMSALAQQLGAAKGGTQSPYPWENPGWINNDPSNQTQMDLWRLMQRQAGEQQQQWLGQAAPWGRYSYGQPMPDPSTIYGGFGNRAAMNQNRYAPSAQFPTIG